MSENQEVNGDREAAVSVHSSDQMAADSMNDGASENAQS